MARPSESLAGWSWGQAALVGARWFLGVAFLYLGAAKAWDPVEFLKQVHAYDLIRDPALLNFVAIVLPWIEILCGLLLLAGIALRGTGLILLILLVGFTSVVFGRGVDLAEEAGQPLCLIKFDCGCGTGEVYVCHKLAENTLLIGLATLPLIWPRQRLVLLPGWLEAETDRSTGAARPDDL